VQSRIDNPEAKAIFDTKHRRRTKGKITMHNIN